ncbi:hypothetical protein [Paenarthrobacter sp. C1]|uniref:hypothetical protein n=1 Tax=Paenarthrobacter sp. C1 TaxID=3400220 RepID=UPI003BF49748
MAQSPVAKAQRSAIKMLQAALDKRPDSVALQRALADAALEANVWEVLKNLVELRTLDRAVARKLATSAPRVAVRSAAFRNVAWTAEEMLELLAGESHASVRHEAFRVPGLPDDVYRDLAAGSKPQPSRLLPAAGHLPLDVLVRAYEAAPVDSSHEHPTELLLANPELTFRVAVSSATALPWRLLATWLLPEPTQGSAEQTRLHDAVRDICAAVDASAAEHEQNSPWRAFGDLRILRELLSGYGTGAIRAGAVEELTDAQRQIVVTFARYGVCASDDYLTLLLDSADEAHPVVLEFLARPESKGLSAKDKARLRRAFILAASRLSFEEAQQALTSEKLELWNWLTAMPEELVARIGPEGVRDVTSAVVAADRCPAWLHTVPDADALARSLGPRALAAAHSSAHKAGNGQLIDVVDRALVATLDKPAPLSGSARDKLLKIVGDGQVADEILADVPLAVVLESKSDVGSLFVERLVVATTAAGGSITVALQTLKTVSAGGTRYGDAVPILEAVLGVTVHEEPSAA